MSNNKNHDEQRNFSPEENEELEFRLWAYIDGISEEPSVIENLIAENAAWRSKYAELMEVHQLVQHTTLDEPSLRFTKNVMEEIARLQITPAAKKYINTKIIWGIAAFFFTVISGFLVYGFSQVEWSGGSSSGGPLDVDLPAIDFNPVFNNSFVNLFLMLNVVLGLFLLDRYLNMKRKRHFEQ